MVADFFKRYDTLTKAFAGITAWGIQATKTKNKSLIMRVPPGDQTDAINWQELLAYVFPIVIKIFPDDYQRFFTLYHSDKFKEDVIAEVLYTANYSSFIDFQEDEAEKSLYCSRLSLIAAPIQLIEYVLNDASIDWKTDVFPKEVIINKFK